MQTKENSVSGIRCDIPDCLTHSGSQRSFKVILVKLQIKDYYKLPAYYRSTMSAFIKSCLFFLVFTQ